jgi:hypothetical protein
MVFEGRFSDNSVVSHFRCAAPDTRKTFLPPRAVAPFVLCAAVERATLQRKVLVKLSIIHHSIGFN